MLRFIWVVILFCVFCFANSAFAKTEYVFLANIYDVKQTQSSKIKDEKQQLKIIAMIEQALNLQTENPYPIIRIRKHYNEQKQIDAFIVYLLSGTTKSVSLIRVDVDADLNPVSINHDYQLQPADLSQSPYYARRAKPYCPDESVQFVIGNNFHYEDSVNTEILRVYELAKNRGYHPILMNINDNKTPVPTVAAYENWFSCPNVKGFYNESHGWKQGIVLADDDLIYSMIDKDLVNKLKHNIVLFDSCETFHNPLLFSMTSKTRANAKQYMAGFILLPFGPSEKTASCIWQQAFNQQPLSQALIRSCAARYGLDPEGFKIMGNGEVYLSPPNFT